MRTFFNIIWWFPYCGFILALFNLLAGVLWCITIIGIPVGLGIFQIAKFQLAPHTRALVSKTDINEATDNEMNSYWKYFALIVRILYFPFGVINAILLAVSIGLNCITLLGIPNGIALAKTFSSVFNPVHKVCVPRAVAEQLETMKAQKQLDKYLTKNETETEEETLEVALS